MEQPSGIPTASRSSGIPRPTSRLPVLRPSGSQSHLRSTPSTEQLRKKPSLSSLPRASQPPPTLQKKSSRTSLARPSIAPTAPANTSSSRASVLSSKRSIPSLAQGRASVADASVFKKPVGLPPSRQVRTTSQPLKATRDAHNEDVLGDLDAFHSASRASSRASSRAGSRDNDTEYAPDTVSGAPKPVARKSRPSLSERTIESLSQLPSSPAVSKTRRRGSFFNSDSSMGPPSRPASAMSNGARPTTGDGTPPEMPTTPGRGALLSQRGSMTAPGKRSSSAVMSAATATPSRISSIGRPPSTIKKQPLSQVQNLLATPKTKPLSNSKTMIARTPKPRPSLGGTLGQAISPPSTTPVAAPSPARSPQGMNKTPETARKSVNSSAALREQLAKAKAAKRSGVATSPTTTTPKPNSSQTLREQIAKAKEAARLANATTSSPRTNTPPRDAIIPDPAEIASFDFGLDDPFNQRSEGRVSLLRKRIDAGRVDGRLNIAALGLSEIPGEVLNMYQYNPDNNTIAWGEVVDLTSLVAADNNLEVLPEAMFPDVDYEAAIDSDDVVPQFGGIQNLDLHGNIFRELPTGLRRLPQLTKLNLSRNRVSMGALQVVFQITTLRELKLAENGLEGAFPANIEDLVLLEGLELQRNKLVSLPPEIRALAHLRTLDVSDNNLSSLPNELFTAVPIVELNASKNSFSGSFLQVDCVPHLQNLQLANNSLTSLCLSDTVLLPSLKYLDLSSNRLSALPDMSAWTNLVTLLVGENSLSSFPEGFASLQQLRNADFTANELNQLDQRIALMEGLENLTLAANPLRERKFLTMNTEDIKRDLMSRLEPELFPNAENLEDAVQSPGDELLTDGIGWQLTPSGTLDLSSQKLPEVDEEAIASFAESHDVRQLYLQQNSLTKIPVVSAQLSFLSVLDLSKNNIVDPLVESLELPKLRELRLGNNKLKSLTTITSMLSAPSLQHLDVSNNRIRGSLPVLREFFPALTLLMASDNSIDEVSADSLVGLRTVSLSNNDIARLEPRIGLLAGTLTSFDVEGNKFRVPNYAILKKGTDAILAWLKDKVPSQTEESFSPGSSIF